MPVIDIRIGQRTYIPGVGSVDSYGEYGESVNNLVFTKRTIFNNRDDGYGDGNDGYQWKIISYPDTCTEPPTLENATSKTSYFNAPQRGTYIIQLTMTHRFTGRKIKGQIAASYVTEKYGLKISSQNEGSEFSYGWQGYTNDNLRTLEQKGIFSNIDGDIFELENNKAPGGDDYVLIEDSGDEYYKKKVSFDKFYKGAFGGTDPHAIHDNVSEEIYNIEEKTSVDGEDLILIEDSDDLYNKKKVKISDLTGSSLQYVSERLISAGQNYYQLTYVPSDALLSDSNKIIKSYKDGEIMWYDAGLPDTESWDFDAIHNSVLFNADSLSKYNFCYWTDGSTLTCHWAEQQVITGTLDFGFSNSIDGETLIVGAYTVSVSPVSTCGTAYVYILSGGVWTLQQQISAYDKAVGDQFGYSVAISGDTCIVGSPFDDDLGTQTGSAYIYTRTLGVWTLQQKITASDGATGFYFGRNVAIDRDIAVIGASISGRAYIFERTGGTWIETQEIFVTSSSTQRLAVSVSGNTVVVGNTNGPTTKGSIMVYVKSGTWSLEQQLEASDGLADDHLGWAVSVFGDTIVAGATDVNPYGAVYIFKRTGSVWAETQKILNVDLTGLFGWSVDVNNSVMIIGDPYAYVADYGSAYIYENINGTWELQETIFVFGGLQVGYWVSCSGFYALCGEFRKSKLRVWEKTCS